MRRNEQPSVRYVLLVTLLGNYQCFIAFEYSELFPEDILYANLTTRSGIVAVIARGIAEC